MSYAHDRESTIAELSRDGWHVRDIRRLLRLASTAQRLAVAQCNGDYPYNGDRDRPSKTFKPCHHCRAEGCLDCQGTGDLQTNGKERQMWDRRYVVCPRCESSGVAQSAMKFSGAADTLLFCAPMARQKVCPDCRNEDQIRAIVAEVNDGLGAHVPKGSGDLYLLDGLEPWHVEIHGDPRGYVARVKRGPFEDSNDRGVIYIPGRE